MHQVEEEYGYGEKKYLLSGMPVDSGLEPSKTVRRVYPGGPSLTFLRYSEEISVQEGNEYFLDLMYLGRNLKAQKHRVSISEACFRDAVTTYIHKRPNPAFPSMVEKRIYLIANWNDLEVHEYYSPKLAGLVVLKYRILAGKNRSSEFLPEWAMRLKSKDVTNRLAFRERSLAFSGRPQPSLFESPTEMDNSTELYLNWR